MGDRKYNHWRPTKDGITLTWSELYVDALITNQHFFSRSSITRKNIINNVTGAVKAGTFVALMGPSGSGKSTLMGALANRNARGIDVSGDIRINGNPIGNYIKKISGYMDQQDLFINCLTIREHLYFMARIKLPRRKSKREILNLIDDILIQLGLAHRADTRIGGNGSDNVLSGGEKKRLSFATEILTNPPLLFCDEPTTGLDSYSAHILVKIMKEMASQGKTIVCTIHQPSSELFDEFNQLILLTEGRIAFMGDRKTALRFFDINGYQCPECYNPADFFLRCLYPQSDSSCAKLDRLCDKFNRSKEAHEIAQLVEHERTIHERNPEWQKYDENGNGIFWWTTFALLLKRSFLIVAREPNIQAFRICGGMVLGAVMALCYAGSIELTQTGVQAMQGVIYLLITENGYGSFFAILFLFDDERPLFMREYKNGLYGPVLYYFAKILSLTPGLILEAALFTAVLYWGVGLRASTYAFLMTIAFNILGTNVATACGCFFLNASSSLSVALIVMIPIMYMQAFTSGVYMKLDSLPKALSWIQYLSWYKYSNEAMSILQWEDVHNITCASNPDLPCLHNGQEVIKAYSYEAENMLFDIIGMIGLYVGFHLLSLSLFYWRARSNK